MTNSDVCNHVNVLTKAVCELQKNNNNNTLKSQLQFHTDFYANRRLIIVSLITFEYNASKYLHLTKDELDLIREFLLSYLQKYEDPNILDVFVSFCNNCLKISFVCYERASVTNDTSSTIQQLETEISRLYENNIFKILDSFISQLPADSNVNKMKTMNSYFTSGTYYTKMNINMLVNRSELEYTTSNWNKSKPCHSNSHSHSYEPAEPAEPFNPEPSEPSDYMPIIQQYSLSKNVNSSIKSDTEIQKAIAKILEISTTTNEVTEI